MEFEKIGLNGGRTPCFRFWEDMMICIKEESIHRSFYKCNKEKADYEECLHNTKLIKRLGAIKQQKDKLIKEGKWPPKED